MSVETENDVSTAQDDQQEIADLMAGYNARGAEMTPPAAVPEASAQPESNPANLEPSTEPDGSQQQDSNGSATPSIEDRIAELKAEIRAQASQNDPNVVRNLYGQIGDINRQLKRLEPKPEPAPAPVDDELTAALKDAERVADDFQELGGPLVSAIKAVAKAQANQAAPAGPVFNPDEVHSLVENRVSQRMHEQAVEALQVDHPDFDSVMRSKEFDAWVKSKPADLQTRIRHTENPMLASRFMSDFKDSQRQQQQVQQQKQNRLASAVTPRGVAAPPAKSKLTADEEIMLGYQKGSPRPIHKR